MKSIVSLIILWLTMAATIVTISDSSYRAFNAALMEIVQTEQYQSEYVQAGFSIYANITCTKGKYPESISKTHYIGCKRSIDDYVTSNFTKYIATQLSNKLSIQYQKDISISIKTIDTAGTIFTRISRAVNDGDCDLMLTPTTITPARQLSVTFLCPYGTQSPSMMRGTLDQERNITNLYELDQHGVKIGIERGSTYAEWAISNITQASITMMDTRQDSFNAVLNGLVHVALHSDRVINVWMEANNVTLETYTYGAPEDQIGVFFPLQDSSTSRTASSCFLLLSLLILFQYII
jgi:hypothetical protein